MKDWFVSELRSMFGTHRGARFALDLSQEKVVLQERSADGWVMRGSASHDADDFEERITEMRAKATGGFGAKAPVDLLLPENLTLYKEDTFPAEGREDIREAAWWRLNVLTRLRPEELCFDVVRLETDADTGFVKLGVAIAQKDIVEEAVAFARQWKFDPQRVTASSEIETFPDGPTFASVEDHHAATRSLRRSAAVLAAAVIVLAVIGVMRGVSERVALADAAAEQRVEAELHYDDAQALRDASIAFAERAEAPALRRRSDPLTIEWLGALARVLPPNAYAHRILVADGKIRLEGVAQNADAVLAAVDVAPEFGGARYAAAVDTTADGALQRFAVEATLVVTGGSE